MKAICSIFLPALALALLASPGAVRAQGGLTLKTVYTFTDVSVDRHGFGPAASLVLGSNGEFYGTTEFGGKNGDGTIFKINQAGKLTTLHTFGPLNPVVAYPTNSDGALPVCALIEGANGNFYGTAKMGGPMGGGTIFEIARDGVFQVLHGFGASTVNNPGGTDPESPLVEGIDGNFYGTTQQGGATPSGVFAAGTVYVITPAGTLTTLYTFGTRVEDGAYPQGSLTQGYDGNFYGTTSEGQGGTFFRITPAGALTTLFTFNGVGSIGISPVGGLVQSEDGNFYGTTTSGGYADAGTVFKITPSGALTTLYSFKARGSFPNLRSGRHGGNPVAPLFRGYDGYFYGTTSLGGPKNDGTIFRMTPAGALTTLVDFIGQYGAYPSASLIQGHDGNFFGTTSDGGSAGGVGTIFRLANKMTPP